jgi:hypothetical protein
MPNVVAVPVVGAGLTVLLAPAQVLLEDFRDAGTVHAQSSALWIFNLQIGGHCGVERLHDGVGDDPLAVALGRSRGVGRVFAEMDVQFS